MELSRWPRPCMICSTSLSPWPWVSPLPPLLCPSQPHFLLFCKGVCYLCAFCSLCLDLPSLLPHLDVTPYSPQRATPGVYHTAPSDWLLGTDQHHYKNVVFVHSLVYSFILLALQLSTGPCLSSSSWYPEPSTRPGTWWVLSKYLLTKWMCAYEEG